MLYYYSIQESVRNYAGVAKLADALDLGSSSYECRFKSCHPHHIFLVLWCSWLTCQSVTLEIAGSSPVGTAILFGWIAQLVEQRIENPCVAGSIPALATSYQI